MSDHGTQVFAADGTTLIFDSRIAQAGVLMDVQALKTTSTTVLSYPAFAGRTAFVMDGCSNMIAAASVDYALGYPRVSLAGGNGVETLQFLIFAS